ncbi:RecQ family ATP-dependent DNA helicase [Sinomicrobium soli]|uniref:RecQ family ATP-dependent DNA helicase n=1 Tax=Sinomicrobium sp. N-1-3-6 TaxID=2219864 RepID=UPI000DCF2FF3|nr:ATP-dependent DNA helicase RecQ [Sinomicrobium sp. N-1-3-6]RAV28600.1 RecQ family ATP-dependent DNA helicase [Sinomicrobium sp. N-1-3-6]
MSTTTEPLHILQKYWGHESFRHPQRQVINALADGRDALVLLPTGGGKSVCFQVPALAGKGICIVISPLIALIRDQVENLKSRGIKAAALTGGMPYGEVDTTLDNCIYGNYKFLYLSPERLQQELVIERLKQMPVSLIAIDEAHCISQWGNDFRPAYRNCGILKEMFPDVPLVALTASATGKVVDDILENLHIQDAAVFRKSFARPNIAYMVFEEEDKLYRLLRILHKNPESSIVYVRNRKATVEISEHLKANGITAGFFHGGIPAADKEEKLRLWLGGNIQVMVATNAFGMGIDKPDVRTVIHMNLPENMESYYQEAGRAGRNGEKAFAVILKHRGDESVLKKQFLEQLPDTAFVKLIYHKLNNYFQIPYGEGENTEFSFNFNSFCTTYRLSPPRTYNSLKLLDRNSVISLSEQFGRKTTLRFTVSSGRLFHYLEKNPGAARATQAILRTYGGVFEGETRIVPQLIAKKLNTPEKEILTVLEQLEKDGIIAYQAENTDARITFLVPREDDITINMIAREIKKQNRQKQEEIASVIRYISDNKTCKSRQILSYFGETDTPDCGICSVCVSHKNDRIPAGIWNIIAEEILKMLKTAPLSSRDLTETLTFREQYILRVLKGLLEEGRISINDKNQYQVKPD